MATKVLAPALGAFLILLGGGANAQNCGGGYFEGPYIGANLGYGGIDARQSSPAEPDIRGSNGSFVAGGQVGYNRQCGRLMLGIEADFNYVGFATNTAWPDPILLEDEVSWFGTVRAKLGITIWDTAMLYATGGLAYADVSHTLVDPILLFRQTDSDVKIGWTIGGGIELAHHERWLLRAEALFVDLGSTSHVYTTVGCNGVCTGRATWDDSFWIARLGLNYKFRGREPSPLK